MGHDLRSFLIMCAGVACGGLAALGWHGLIA